VKLEQIKLTEPNLDELL